ncbi:hypothetical protein SAMN05428950_101889 [Sphingomonas sp. OV641]|uniref:hypothetical protein n=1 Tax=Sphingomonas sp. OV641 TaxID=1881068 RepID=UPI0008BE49E7|nr:hypothetical protein [Sphingomonas sp. OV641]SEJ02658.1 hypothetical protein SAMN05428950_101889 [Sphingomonas sp. OV641]
MTPAMRETLVSVAAVMQPERDPWWIVGSAAVALLGVSPVRVAEIDALLSVRDAAKILPMIGVEPIRNFERGNFRSEIFATWRGNAMRVEFMAGVETRVDEKWESLVLQPRQAIAVDGALVFVPSLVELLGMLVGFGRPKDRERVRLLTAKL